MTFDNGSGLARRLNTEPDNFRDDDPITGKVNGENLVGGTSNDVLLGNTLSTHRINDQTTLEASRNNRFSLASLMGASDRAVEQRDSVKAPIAANAKQEREIFSGTYLTTPIQNSPLRSIITFTEDHNIFIVDSIQGGIKGMVNPFSETHGIWKQTGKRKIDATILNFSYPTTDSPGTVARGDLSAKFSPQGQTVKGTITVRLFDLQQDPLTSSGPPDASYTFTGQRLTPLENFNPAV